MDKLRTDELRPGHRIKLTAPLPNRPEDEFAVVRDVVMMDEGAQQNIYRIDFDGSDFGLAAVASRVFEVQSAQPGELRRRPA